MGDRVIRASLGDLRQAVRARQSHVSFNTRRLLFIHKKGRDRYDFIKGCRPIRCLSHLQSLDEGMLQVIVTKHVNATRSDINNGYRARTTCSVVALPVQ